MLAHNIALLIYLPKVCLTLLYLFTYLPKVCLTLLYLFTYLPKVCLTLLYLFTYLAKVCLTLLYLFTYLPKVCVTLLYLFTYLQEHYIINLNKLVLFKIASYILICYKNGNIFFRMQYTHIHMSHCGTCHRLKHCQTEEIKI